MKKLMPWICLIAGAGVGVAFADNGLEAYREGNYTKAAQKLLGEKTKDALVDYYLGRMRLYGYGQLKNDTAALRYFTRSAEKGYLPAQRIMARYELLVAHNPEKALVWFKKSADLDDTDAQMYCAAAYLYGVGTKKNSETAKRYYIAAAKNGNSIAQYTLAKRFIGSRYSSNKKLGVIWLRKSVEQNNPDAQALFGQLYTDGKLVDRDLVQAKELLNASIAQGNVPALYYMGALCAQENEPEKAKDWYTKAADAHYSPAQMALAKLYLQEKSPMYDPSKGFLWTLKAAQNGSKDAKLALAAMYKKGEGVAADERLASEWEKKAKTASNITPEMAEAKAAQWLTNGKATTLATSGYQLRGILSDWQNPLALKNNNYNQSPQMDSVAREVLYHPKFVLTNPNEIPISDYYNALAALLNPTESANLDFPRYSLDKQRAMSEYAEFAKQANTDSNADVQTLVQYLVGRATLGDHMAQFTLGQMYQNGIDVEKNVPEAVKYYEMATEQQNLPAEYNLALLLLEGEGAPADYQRAVNLLRDAAFKGNDHAQYALALIYEQGYQNAAGETLIQPNRDQAIDMYNLAAVNQHGPAQYRLAEILVREKPADMSVATLQKRNEEIKSLYQNAFLSGVHQAALPLAFFNAMDKDTAKQAEAFEVAKKEASAGRAGAALLLGLLYDRGIAVPENHDEAVHWYQQAHGNPVSEFILGSYTSQGAGLSKDVEQGKALLQKSAEAGFSPAHFNLAVLQQESGETFLPELEKAYVLGNGRAGLLLADYYLSVANDSQQMQQARDIYQSLAEKGNREGQLKLGYMLDRGLGGKVDSVQAEKWYRLAADQNQPMAQYLLGQLYQLGRVGRQPDYAEAKKWYSLAQSQYIPAAVALGFIYDTVDDDYQRAQAGYESAAQKQDPTGQFDLGLVYEQGKGRPVDFSKARALYLEAANQGHPEAMVQLAGLAFNGLGGGRDESGALEWYQKAAGLGEPAALYQLGLMSESGVATPMDLAAALNYYQKSADKGNAKAMSALARMYQYGLGVKQDYHQAEKLYEALAALGNASAQYQLANLYLEGIDGKPMPDKGKQLLKQAANNGSAPAQKWLQRLEAEGKTNVSFLEPVVINQAPSLTDRPVDLLYMDALSAWDRGEEPTSRLIFNQIKTQFPDYAPAKRAYEQLNHAINPGMLSINRKDEATHG